MKDILISVIMFAVFVTIFFIVFLFVVNNLTPFASYHFCNKMGYDGTSLFGEYSPMYGRINCASCYNGECTFKEFYVTKTWYGFKEKK